MEGCFLQYKAFVLQLIELTVQFSTLVRNASQSNEINGRDSHRRYQRGWRTQSRISRR